MSAKKRGPGRPKLPRGKAKGSIFAVRLALAERTLIQRATKKAGMESASDWARGALLAAAYSATEERHAHGFLLKRQLKRGEAIDLSSVGRHVPAQDVYELYDFDEKAEREYWDLASDRPVWSIGKNKEDGRIFAAFDTRFYSNPKYECVWLR